MRSAAVRRSGAPAPSAAGLASWYGADFHGKPTANGERFDIRAFTAAHPTMPLPSYARVTNVSNGKSIVVRVNDRGPYHRGRLIDVSQRTAEVLGFRSSGVGAVKVDYVGPASLDGSDERKLIASYQEFGRPGAPEGVQIAGLRPVTDIELAAGGGASAKFASAGASAQPVGLRPALSAPAMSTPSASAYAAPQPLVASQPAPAALRAVASAKPAAAAGQKRVVQPGAPVLASSAPALLAKPMAPASATVRSVSDVSSRIAASFEGFGDPRPLSAGRDAAVPAEAAAFTGVR